MLFFPRSTSFSYTIQNCSSYNVIDQLRISSVHMRLGWGSLLSVRSRSKVRFWQMTLPPQKKVNISIITEGLSYPFIFSSKITVWLWDTHICASLREPKLVCTLHVYVLSHACSGWIWKTLFRLGYQYLPRGFIISLSYPRDFKYIFSFPYLLLSIMAALDYSLRVCIR